MTDTVTDTTRGGCVVRPDGEYVGLRPELPWAGTVGTAPSAALPHVNSASASGTEASAAPPASLKQPALLVIQYRSATGVMHVAIGWLTSETDTHYRLSGDLTLYKEDAKLKVTGELPPNHVPKRNIIKMFEVTADGAGELLAYWGNTEMVGRRI